MTDSALISNAVISAVDVITPLYTSPSGGLGTVIRAISVSNNSSASASYKIYIYPASGVAGSAIAPLKIVVKDRFDAVAAAVNQVIPAGGTLRAENSTGNALNFNMTGLEQ